MYAPWARAFRSTALHRARIAIRPEQCFHTSTPARAAADSTPKTDAPDASDKPDNDEKDLGSHESSKDENLFGEKTPSGSAEARGRQKRSTGPFKIRALRSRTPELPPVHLPREFLDQRIWRHKGAELDQSRVNWPTQRPQDSEQALELAEQTAARLTPAALQTLQNAFDNLVDTVSWNTTEAQLNQLTLRHSHAESFLERGSILLLASSAHLLTMTIYLAKDLPNKRHLVEQIYHLSQGITAASFQFQSQYLEMYRYCMMGFPVESTTHALERVLESKVRFYEFLGLLHHDLLVEAVSSIRADFAINAPHASKEMDIRRPITVLNFPYYSGDAWPRHIIQDIATRLEADVVHLTAHDIAHIVGSYLGQDVTRAPGPISLLGYTAAENAGRIRRQVVQQHDARIDPHLQPFAAFVIPTEKPRKDARKKLSIVDLVLGDSHRDKSDEAWVNLKVNNALDELVRAADSETAEQRPLIVHIHDFNALNMDDECGSIIMAKLRKIVDSLWMEGRKVVLVGTCASRDTPPPYGPAMTEAEKTERIITLHTSTSMLLPSKKDAASADIDSTYRQDFVKNLETLQEGDCLNENAGNIGTMLHALLKSNYDDVLPRINFDFHEMNPKQRPQILCEKVLSVNEVHRIAKTMIGIREQQPEVFDQDVLEEAVRFIKTIDEAKDQLAMSKDKAEGDIMRNFVNGTGPPLSDYEERFLSSLIDPKDIRTTFKDVHAPRATIDSIKMLTQLSLLRPEAFAYGVLATDRIPGCLLYGPPGTGKTLLAKAVAKESGANMIEVSGANINNMYVGEGEKNIKALFKLAKRKEPLVVFIDEADALLGARGGFKDSGGRRDVINQFLREWDGMDTTKAFIMVATNRPFDLDEAVLRRLPRKLLIDLPLEEDRAAILRIHLKDEALDDSVSIEQMAKQTPLYSGSDLKNVCVAAAMAAVKEELEASEKYKGPEPYVWPEKRVLNRKHFDKGLAEIPASVSEDMATLNAIKKFDQRYGDGKSRRKRHGMGFEVIPEATDSHEARVRSVGM